jgi:hypothetical protein
MKDYSFATTNYLGVRPFQTIDGLDSVSELSVMIFKASTFHQLDMLNFADTWPRDDPKRGLLMFSRPWVTAEKKKEYDKLHEAKKAANAA